MKKVFLSFMMFLLFCGVAVGQGKSVNKEVVSVSMFQLTTSFQMPALDTKDLYGFNSLIGGSFIYKTNQNWLWTINAGFPFGKNVKLDRIQLFGEGITTTNGEIISGDGIFTQIATFQRGTHLQLEVGKLFPLMPNPNSGVFVQGGLGYFFNRIRIEDQFSITPQLADDFKLAYDRMRGGPAAHAEVGYLFMSDSRVLNFSLSLEVTYARTRNYRDYDFRIFYDENGEPHPVGYLDPSKRFNDLYYGIRLSWIIPVYSRQPADFYYY